MEMVAEDAIVLGARGGREAGFLAMQADQRMGVLDRGAIGKKGGWQVHRFLVHYSEPFPMPPRLTAPFPTVMNERVRLIAAPHRLTLRPRARPLCRRDLRV
jgi:hypothetical protein